MKYHGQEVEILTLKKVFGKEIAEIKILSTGELKSVHFSDLSKDKDIPAENEIYFKAIAGKIKAEIYKQTLFSPLESSVIPLPHQILALEKIMSGQFLRFLIADEVGMGKTIEAGLVLKELKIRGIVKKTLIIVPKSAMSQWQAELKKHFNESFKIYDSEYINALSKTFARIETEANINLFKQHSQIIVSMDALKPLISRSGWSKEKIEEYNNYRINSVLDADFDLLIIDECHKVGGSNPLVGRFLMAETLCNAIPNVLLLSATPHRGKGDHFRRVLKLLDADAFSDDEDTSLAKLMPYVVRTEKRQAVDYEGKKLFNKRFTRKIEVHYDDELHKKQKMLYEAVTEYVIDGFNLAQQTKNNSYAFIMLLFQRMMSSSTQAILYAMEKRYEKLQKEKDIFGQELTHNPADEIDISKIRNLQNDDDEHFLNYDEYTDFDQELDDILNETLVNYEVEQSILKKLVQKAKDCMSIETDAKVDFLLDKLKELKAEEGNPDLKFLIFTDFTATQYMLKEVLEDKGGYYCDIINGSMDTDQRLTALKKFKKETQILICTDAAGESLNMQFAHIIINYDIPWNPMILEQRIGRVDRIGQKHEVKAINIMLDNSIDKRVYEVIETKLTQIMEQLGIDKTSDVLDSTLEQDQVNQLYLNSLLKPDQFDEISEQWLSEIKSKLLKYKSTEGILPTMASKDISVNKTDALKHSPLHIWLENLTKKYLDNKNITYELILDGLKFKFPGYGENIYTFNIKDNIDNPIPEPVSLQHNIIQTIISEAVPYTESQNIPIVKLQNFTSCKGFWSLWHLEVQNQLEAIHIIQPIFISDEGDYFPAYAQDLWNKLVQEDNILTCTDVVSGEDKSKYFFSMFEHAESILHSKYQEFESKIIANTAKIKQNKERNFAFQERQMNRIGIENIKKFRLNKLFKEKEMWFSNFDETIQIVPKLNCLLIFKVEE